MMAFLRQMLIAVGAVGALITLPSAFELLLVTSGVLRRRSRAASRPADGFSLAVVIPAHNEEAMIGRCVASLLASAVNGPRCSVIVVADNCTDATAVRAREAGARVLVRDDAAHRGKGFALRYAFNHLMEEGFDGFLMVDADSVVSLNLVPEITRGLLGGADALQARYRVTPSLVSKQQRLMDVASLAMNVVRPLGRNGWGLSAGILGNGFSLSRQTLLDVPYSAESIVEDLEYHLMLVNARKKVYFADAATVYGDMPDEGSAQLLQRARWEGGRARLASTWIPKLAARLLGGNIFLLEPLLELLTLPVAYVAVLALVLSALPVGPFRWYGVFLVGLLVAHIAAGVALGGNPRESLAALANAPGYVFWKLTHMGRIMRSGSGKQWQRTPRSSDEKPEAPPVY